MGVQQASALTVVSDYDDTIKISNSNETVDSVRRSMFSREVFYGAREYFHLVEAQGVRWWVLSGAPKMAMSSVRKTLAKHSMHPSEIVLRKYPNGPDVFEHKVKVLRNFLYRAAGEQLVLIGDDQQKDPEAYLQIAREFPGRVLAIYIHRVQNRPVESRPGDSIDFFWTWQELVWKEFVRARIPAQDLLKYEAIWERAEIKRAEVFPGFAACPTEVSEFGVISEPMLLQKWLQFASRWTETCIKRLRPRELSLLGV